MAFNNRPVRRTIAHTESAQDAHGVELHREWTPRGERWTVREFAPDGDQLQPDLDEAQAKDIYVQKVHDGAQIDGRPAWSLTDVPGVPLNTYAVHVEYQIMHRDVRGSMLAWKSFIDEQGLLGTDKKLVVGKGAHPITSSFLAEPAHTLQDVLIAGFDEANEYFISFYGQPRWRAMDSRPAEMPYALRVTVEGTTAQGPEALTKEEPFHLPQPPADQEDNALTDTSVLRVRSPHPGGPTARLPFRAPCEPHTGGPHWITYLPESLQDNYLDPTQPTTDGGQKGLLVLMDNRRPAALLILEADSPEALEAAQRDQAAALEPWAPAVLWLARHTHLEYLSGRLECAQTDEEERAGEERLAAAASEWERQGLLPLPESSVLHRYEEGRFKTVQALLARLEASAVAALPDPAVGPLPALAPQWSRISPDGGAMYGPWADDLTSRVIKRQRGCSPGPGRDNMVRWAVAHRVPLASVYMGSGLSMHTLKRIAASAPSPSSG